MLLAAFLALPLRVYAATERLVPPRIAAVDRGAVIERVSIETFGVVKPGIVRRYLSLHAGDRLEQRGVDRDFNNLLRLGAYQPRLEIERGEGAGRVRLRWIVQSKWLKPTTHPYYADQPLSAPIQGVGFVLTGPPLDRQGAAVSAYTQFSRRANIARILYTQPLTVDASKGEQSSFVFDEFGGKGDFRASEPKAVNVYSWTTGQEALWLQQSTNGTQVETGVRVQRSTDELFSGVTAPSLFSTYAAPAHNTLLLAGVSHACLTGPNRWYPPYCSLQYRFAVTDGIGGLGATDTFRILTGDVAKYVSLGGSTLALHATIARTGGVLPDSFLLCAVARGYPKSFCGTDEQGLTAEFRLDDHQNRPLQFVFFTETASSRVRNAPPGSVALPYFTWHPDSGVGIIYHLVRVNVAYGQQGGRITLELKGQTF